MDELDALSSGSNGDANGDADALEGLSSDHEGGEVEVPVDPDAKLEVVRKVKQAFGNANNTRHRSNLKRTVLRAGLKIEKHAKSMRAESQALARVWNDLQLRQGSHIEFNLDRDVTRKPWRHRKPWLHPNHWSKSGMLREAFIALNVTCKKPHTAVKS